jgi:ABC-type lipoprotein release transport system permease subunit
MGAVWLVFGVKLRRYWRSWLLLTLLIAIVSGFALAATAAGRRTDAAFPRYVARHGYDAIVYTVQPLPGLAKLPGVAQVTTVNLPFAGQPRCSCGHQISYGEFAVREVPAAALDRAVKLVAGRMPDQSSQVEALASYTLQRDYGVHPGTVITVPLAGASQREAVFKALAGGPVPKPEGPVIAVRVTGIVAAENEFPSGGGPSYDLYPTTAFATATRDTPALPTYQVRLRHGLADLARFEAVASQNGAVGVEDLDRPAAAITSSIHPQAVGWWVLAALAGLAGLAVAGQALARQTAAESADHPALAALGLSPRQLVAVSMMRTLATAVAGAAGGIAVATLLSPLAPAGEARLADPAPGLSFDAAVLGLGALATVAVVLVLGVLPALRGARVRAAASRVAGRRPSAVAAAVAAAGASPGAAIGIRYALEPGRGTRAVPVRTALTGSVAAVAAICATAVFGASQAHQTATPALYGAPFQMYFNYSGPGGTSGSDLLTDLKHDDRIDQITVASLPDVTVNHVQVRTITASSLRGSMLLSAVQGRLPAGAGQIALGASTMRSTGARIGGSVRVIVADPSGAPHTRSFRVVGMLAFPGDFTTGGLGTGAAMTTPGYVAAQCPPGPKQAACLKQAGKRIPDLVVIHAVDGPAGQAALDHYGGKQDDNAARPVIPAALVNFGESANFPLLLGGIVTLCGLATLGHLLVVSVARRRAENGLLRALGMVGRQLASVVFWQATTVAVIAIVLGIPIGIAAGQAIWRAFAVSLGVVPAPVVHAWPLAAVAAGVLVTANVLAAIPALSAARSRPGRVLRTE